MLPLGALGAGLQADLVERLFEAPPARLGVTQALKELTLGFRVETAEIRAPSEEPFRIRSDLGALHCEGDVPPIARKMPILQIQAIEPIEVIPGTRAVLRIGLELPLDLAAKELGASSS